MRWSLLFLLAACSFEHGAIGGFGQEAGVTIDSLSPADARGDGRAIDAGPVDASSTCIAKATQTFGGHHYFATGNGSWQTSQDVCTSFGGHLVKIESQTETAAVANSFPGGTGFVWIGLSDPTNTDVYVWTDLTPLSPTYNGFAGGNPPASSSNCVDSNGTWETFGCTATNHGGVCECE